jgi:enolase
MSAGSIDRVQALEILDSRGRPTVEATVVLRGGLAGTASVPAGASTGRHEAVERRDGGTRYRGLGVRACVRAIETEVSPALAGLDAAEQRAIDARLIELDGTADKSRLGANTTLAVSLAAARAAARVEGVPLWRRLGGDPLLPLPMVNMLSGGLHASGGVEFQDFLAMPISASSFSEALEVCVRVRDSLGDRLAAAGLTTLKADEGGFGPPLAGAEAALTLLVEAVAAVGLEPGHDVAFGLDVAATHFHDAATETYRLGGESLTASELVDHLDELVDRYPIVSLEDPLGEDDWEGWREAGEMLGGRVQLIGDDLFVTNGERLAHGIELGVANAVLVKMNQAGTLTETLDVVEQARGAGYATVASARSGETEDDALADLAVGTRAGQIKVGSVAQSERLAKYNRLLRIESELGEVAEFAGTRALAPLGDRA